MDKIVFTGGPGTGKTTLLDYLRSCGHIVTKEQARSVIEEEQWHLRADPAHKAVLPWLDSSAFQQRVMDQQLTVETFYAGYERPDLLLLDRGLGDQVGYCLRDGIPLPPRFHEHLAKANYSLVFMLERVATYKQDGVRYEDEAEAIRTHECIRRGYESLGYRVIDVPAFRSDAADEATRISESVERRAQFVLERLAEERTPAHQREVEGKYRVKSHEDVTATLAGYAVEHCGTRKQRDRYFDLFGILGSYGCTLRARTEDGARCITFKGPSRGDGLHDRFEYEFAIPEVVGRALDYLPAKRVVEKTREVYHPLHDQNVQIALDNVRGLGHFVEIEAPSAGRVEQWRTRLGLGAHVGGAYMALPQQPDNDTEPFARAA